MQSSMLQDMKEFLLYLKVEKNLAPRTILEYENDLKLLGQFLQNRQIVSWDQVTYRELRRFLHYSHSYTWKITLSKTLHYV